MAKPKVVKTVLKLNLRAGAANPAPPIGPMLGQAGVNIMEFCNQYNEATKEMRGEVVPAVITVYTDSTFKFVLKKAPVSAMIMKKLNLKKGASNVKTENMGTLNEAQLREIAEEKLEDLNANTVEAAMNIVAGTARSMGVKVEGREQA